MDLRRIVEEVEERRREEYALLVPAKPRPSGGGPSGLAASIFESVRDRMLRENPEADVSSITRVIEPDRLEHRADPPAARVAHEPIAARMARELKKAEEHPSKVRGGKTSGKKEDFLARYLLMSEEFERRYHAKGWTDLVRKRSGAALRH